MRGNLLLVGGTATISAPSSSGSRDEQNKKEWAKNPLFSFVKRLRAQTVEKPPRDRAAASNRRYRCPDCGRHGLRAGSCRHEQGRRNLANHDRTVRRPAYGCRGL